MPSIRELRLRKDISHAFSRDQDLAAEIGSTVARHPETGQIFQRIIEYFALDEAANESERPAKRAKTEQPDNLTSTRSSKIDVDAKSVTSSQASSAKTAENSEPILTVRDLSFVSPVRKKLSLIMSKDSLIAVQPNDATKVEVDINCADIRDIALLPVPDKAAKTFNFCIFMTAPSEDVFVFTIPDTPPKTASGPARDAAPESLSTSYKSLLTYALNEIMSPVTVMEPNTKDFTSAIAQPHRKHEPAVHITAHRGSKEGYLFLLTNGLLYGFKRPLLFLPLSEIKSVTYNDILQRTFNLTVATQDSSVEFSMIDIAEHDLVDKYVKKFELSDESLSEARKARLTGAAKGTGVTSEINKANEIAAGLSGDEKMDNDDDDDDDDDEDEAFHDEESHSGSTLASDESDSEADVEEAGSAPSASHDEEDEEL